MSCAPNATRTRDLPLRRSFHAAGQAAVLLVKGGLLVVWLQLNVSGFRPVLARGWNEARTSMRTIGKEVHDGCSWQNLQSTSSCPNASQAC